MRFLGSLNFKNDLITRIKISGLGQRINDLLKKKCDKSLN